MNKKIMITVISSVLAVAIAATGIFIGVKSKDTTFEVSDTFTFRSAEGGDKSDLTFEYSDAYFESSACEYNQDLAKLSIRMAAATFNSADNGPDGMQDYSEKSKNIVDLLKKCKFENIEVNDDYKNKPTENSIGVCVGEKKIGKYTLLAVAVRGGGYEAEWAGNFACYTSDRIHPGFKTAADQVEDFVLSYIERNIRTEKKNDYDKGKVKIWISGYSRAGAVTNLAAKYFDDIDLLSKENVYAYTFEAPQPTAEEVDESLYSNIFNIINPLDIVPKVVMSDWGYHHYGVDIEIPYGQDVNYTQSFDKVLEKFKEYTGNENISLPNASEQAAALDNLASILASYLESADSDKTEKYSNRIREYFLSKDYSDGKSSSGFFSDLLPTIISTVAFFTGNDDLRNQINSIDDFTDSVKKAHYPELEMAWLDTYELKVIA